MVRTPCLVQKEGHNFPPRKQRQLKSKPTAIAAHSCRRPSHIGLLSSLKSKFDCLRLSYSLPRRACTTLRPSLQYARPAPRPRHDSRTPVPDASQTDKKERWRAVKHPHAPKTQGCHHMAAIITHSRCHYTPQKPIIFPSLTVPTCREAPPHVALLHS